MATDKTETGERAGEARAVEHVAIFAHLTCDLVSDGTVWGWHDSRGEAAASDRFDPDLRRAAREQIDRLVNDLGPSLWMGAIRDYELLRRGAPGLCSVSPVWTSVLPYAIRDATEKLRAASHDAASEVGLMLTPTLRFTKIVDNEAGSMSSGRAATPLGDVDVSSPLLSFYEVHDSAYDEESYEGDVDATDLVVEVSDAVPALDGSARSALRVAAAQRELLDLTTPRLVHEAHRAGFTQAQIASDSGLSQPTVSRTLARVAAAPDIVKQSPREFILQRATGALSSSQMRDALMRFPYTHGRHEPEGSVDSVYVPGTWDQVRQAHQEGLLSDLEWELLRGRGADREPSRNAANVGTDTEPKAAPLDLDDGPPQSGHEVRQVSTTVRNIREPRRGKTT